MRRAKVIVYCIRCPVKWPGIAGYHRYEQRVSTVCDVRLNSRAGTTGVYCRRESTHRVGAEGNGLLYAMSG
ncbi:hypothetical protein DB351_07860 [Klebsiella pneumoniae]|nr:hypothetical protein DB351_07860 [Klebsiella pneumoniae]